MSAGQQPHKARKLGTLQQAVLEMMNPEWVSSTGKPDAVAQRVLESLEARGFVYRNYARWTITPAGRAALANANEEKEKSC